MSKLQNSAAQLALKTALKAAGVPSNLVNKVMKNVDVSAILKSAIPSGVGNPQMSGDALSRLTADKEYGRPMSQKIGQDYIIPGVATATSAIGKLLSLQYGLGGNILAQMAASGSNGRREQHGGSLTDMAASAAVPYSHVKSGAASVIGDSAAHLINSMGNRARTNTLNDLEAKHQKDMLLAYGSPSSTMSSAQYDWIHQMNAMRKDALNREAQAYELPSDERIKDIMSRTGKFTEDDVAYLASLAGDMDEDHCFERDGNCWRDDILNKYAEYIQNFVYTYKPEASAIDPSIDPNEEHIGPMAQDIEKVNPACIKETPEGVKTVDTGRLALMNAGAIAELAREVKEMKE